MWTHSPLRSPSECSQIYEMPKGSICFSLYRDTMRIEYVREALGELDEVEVQDLIQKAHENDGWKVRNIHESDRGHEEGVDLECERKGKKRLIAVKLRPGKQDIEQLDVLAKRFEEGELLYVYTADPTVAFQKKIDDVKVVNFLGPSDLHSMLIQREVVDYLVDYLGVTPIAKEMAESVTAIWEARKVAIHQNLMGTEDLRSIWMLKDAILKTRAAVGIVATQWDDDLMGRTDIREEEFEKILDDVVRDLDRVQSFTGGNLSQAFKMVKDRTPHVLSLVWTVIRPRTNWMHFAGIAEQLSSRNQVYEFARRFWALPGSISPLPSAKMNRDNMLSFYSGLAGILRNLAQVAGDLDDGIDWAWQDMQPKKNP